MSKNNEKNKLFELILIILFVTAVLVWLAVFKNSDKFLHVYFLDVGQGDSIYVRDINSNDIIIDGGPDKSVLNELGRLMPFWDRKIEMVILTHPHSDHIYGLIEIAKKYKIDEIYMTDAVTTTDEYSQWLNEIKNKNIKINIIKENQKKLINNQLEIDFLWPLKSFENINVENLNNTSIVAKIIYNNFSVLLTGDIENEVQTQLVDEDLKSTVLKIPHHGSANFSKEFLEKVNAEYAVIMVGENNKFHHPAEKTLDALKELNYKILRTDKNGTIEFISNGINYWQNTTIK